MLSPAGDDSNFVQMYYGSSDTSTATVDFNSSGWVEVGSTVAISSGQVQLSTTPATAYNGVLYDLGVGFAPSDDWEITFDFNTGTGTEWHSPFTLWGEDPRTKAWDFANISTYIVASIDNQRMGAYSKETGESNYGCGLSGYGNAGGGTFSDNTMYYGKFYKTGSTAYYEVYTSSSARDSGSGWWTKMTCNNVDDGDLNLRYAWVGTFADDSNRYWNGAYVENLTGLQSVTGSNYDDEKSKMVWGTFGALDEKRVETITHPATLSDGWETDSG